MASESQQVEDDRRLTVDEQLSNDVHLRVIAGLRQVQLALDGSPLADELGFSISQLVSVAPTTSFTALQLDDEDDAEGWGGVMQTELLQRPGARADSHINMDKIAVAAAAPSRRCSRMSFGEASSSTFVRSARAAAVLCNLAAQGDVDGLRRLLSEDGSLGADMKDYDRRTPLHIAAAEGQLAMVRYLCEVCRVPVSAVDRWGGTPLDDALRSEEGEVVAYLRSNGAEQGDGETRGSPQRSARAADARTDFAGALQALNAARAAGSAGGDYEGAAGASAGEGGAVEGRRRAPLASTAPHPALGLHQLRIDARARGIASRIAHGGWGGDVFELAEASGDHWVPTAWACCAARAVASRRPRLEAACLRSFVAVARTLRAARP